MAILPSAKADNQPELLGSYEKTFTGATSGICEFTRGSASLTKDLSLFKFVICEIQLRKADNNSYIWGTQGTPSANYGRGATIIYNPQIYIDYPSDIQSGGILRGGSVALMVAPDSVTNQSPYSFVVFEQLPSNANAAKLLIWGMN